MSTQTSQGSCITDTPEDISSWLREKKGMDGTSKYGPICDHLPKLTCSWKRIATVVEDGFQAEWGFWCTVTENRTEKKSTDLATLKPSKEIRLFQGHP